MEDPRFWRIPDLEDLRFWRAPDLEGFTRITYLWSFMMVYETPIHPIPSTTWS